MKLHHYTVFALFIFAAALTLFALQPVTAMQTNAQGQVIELTIDASGSNLPAHPIKVQVHEGEVSTMMLHKPGQMHYQYMIRAERPASGSLPAASRQIASPLAMSIRIDASEDGKTWLLQTHANLITTLGSTVAAEFSDMDKSTNLIVSSRLVSDAEHRARKL